MKMRVPSNNAIIKILAIVVLVIIATSATATSFANANINTDGTMDLHKEFPSHWGVPPLRQTRDYVPLPEPYGGRGSSTLKKWIEQKMEEDAAAAEAVAAAEAGEESNARRFADPDAASTSTASVWPKKSLIGMTGEDAKEEIKNVDPSLEVQVLPEDSMVTMDYRTDRVRIFVDSDGKVVRQPNAG